MASIDIRTQGGGNAGSAELDDRMFGITPNVPVMHQVVTAQLAAKRAGTQSTKTRSEVAGGGAKPFKQKGTGRARQGSIRAPHWRGGGVALGPKPRSYAQKTPKKMVALALRSALSDRAAEGRVMVIDEWRFDAPSTKHAKQALGVLGLDGKVLLVVDTDNEVVVRSFRNLPEVHICDRRELNAYDVLCSDWVVFTRETLPTTAASPAAAIGTVAEPIIKETPVAEPTTAEAPEAPGAPENTAPAEEVGE
jgi:large subunit ribosomal protein L4